MFQLLLSSSSFSFFIFLLSPFHIWKSPWPDNLTERSVPMFPALPSSLTYLYILPHSLTNCWLEWNQVKNTLQKYPGINCHGSLPPSSLASGVLRQGLHSYSCREPIFPAFTKQFHFISMDPPGRRIILSMSKGCFPLKTQSRLYFNKPIREKKTKSRWSTNQREACSQQFYFLGEGGKNNYPFSNFKERLVTQCRNCFTLFLNH